MVTYTAKRIPQKIHWGLREVSRELRELTMEFQTGFLIEGDPCPCLPEACRDTEGPVRVLNIGSYSLTS